MKHSSLFALLLLLVLTLPVFATGKEEPARAILILDASGSMWGKVKGKPKIEIAREVVRDLLANWNPSLHLGLMVYGHRSKGDCNDIELLIPPGPVDKAAFLKAVEGLTPKGKTPLTDAVLAAAAALRSTEEKATVILVSDGLETCGKDPCAAAEQLEKEGFDFTAHVVGFDLSEADQKAIRCLSDKTGGAFVAASDAASLRKALEEVVEKTVAPTPTPEPKPTPTPTPQTPKVTFRTLLGEGGEAVEPFYTITNAEGKMVARGTRSDFPIESGTYTVELNYENNKQKETIEVSEENREFTFIAGLGRLTLKTLVDEGGEEAEVYYTIYEAPQGEIGKRNRVKAGSSSKFSLPAGKYLVESKWGQAVVEKEVEIETGKTVEVILSLEAGLLVVKATATEGGEEVSAFYTISGKAKLDGSRPQIAASSNGTFRLPAGSYHVEARWGAARTTQEVTVKPGERNEAVLALGAGVLELAAADPKDGAPFVEIFEAASGLEGKAKRVAFGSAKEQYLPAGRYRVEAKLKGGKASTEVEVQAGQRVKATLSAPQP